MAVTRQQILNWTGGSNKGADIYRASQQHGFTPQDVNSAFSLDPGTAESWMDQNVQGVQGPVNQPTPIYNNPDDAELAPDSPNYWEGANVQGDANLQSGLDTTRISNPNVYSPYGNQTVTYGPDGKPEINIDAPGLINKPLGEYRFPKVQGLDTEGLPGVGQLSNQGLFNLSPADSSELSGRSIEPTVGGFNAVADALREREAPRFERMREQTEADLIARGFNPGTEGWEGRMDDINRRETDFNLGLIPMAGQEQSRLFNMESGQRGQELDEMLAEFGTSSRGREQLFGERGSIYGTQEERRKNALAEQLSRYGTEADTRGRSIDEQVLARELPLREFTTMMSLPSYTGANVGPAPYMDAMNNQGLFDLGRYGTGVQEALGQRQISANKNAANRGAAGDLIGSGLSAAATYLALSDKRLKKNIRFMGKTLGGHNLYQWDWKDAAIGQPTFGVMAQELLETLPEAVSVGDDGFYRVDYARVF